MRRVAWADAALRDLDRIKDYLGRFDSASASREVRSLVLAARWLLDNPGAGPAIGIGSLRKWRPGRSRYVILYQPDRDGIGIVRVRHSAEDRRETP